ncbi:hypothetical protein ARTHRO_40646 [Limnospira indica PCC 8005]|uniref:Uncharacterized protein n=1 Tax=Limnospira indica PCC 8005 TaxID=376219 RepID=A0A9P1KIP5_9CYAN|nr:hypothetical protein ARTHRO_40646 [Limnospira indica PCC 8005]
MQGVDKINFCSIVLCFFQTRGFVKNLLTMGFLLSYMVLIKINSQLAQQRANRLWTMITTVPMYP